MDSNYSFLSADCEDTATNPHRQCWSRSPVVREIPSGAVTLFTCSSPMASSCHQPEVHSASCLIDCLTHIEESVVRPINKEATLVSDEGTNHTYLPKPIEWSAFEHYHLQTPTEDGLSICPTSTRKQKRKKFLAALLKALFFISSTASAIGVSRLSTPPAFTDLYPEVCPSTGLCTKLACSVTFAISTACLYSLNCHDEDQAYFLLCGFLSGICIGLATMMDLESILLRVLPWTILLSLALSNLVHGFAQVKREPRRLYYHDAGLETVESKC